jgi:hypothetical protein
VSASCACPPRQPDQPGTRVTVREIRQVECPACGALPGHLCNRLPDRRGVVRNHQERMWIAQGHTPDCFEAIREGQRPGKRQYRRAS